MSFAVAVAGGAACEELSWERLVGLKESIWVN